MADEEILVVASKVRAHLKSKNVKMSSELIGQLNHKVKWMLDEAAKRAQGNKRATVKPQDI